MTEQLKLKQNATEAVRGTVYQLFVAIDKCYEMYEAGQKVLIETQGDVTKVNNEQVEVKHYTGDLTDNHVCFWNTLYNWMQDRFDYKSYKYLILYTTQKFGNEAKIQNWNNESPTKRLQIITDIHSASEARYINRVKKSKKCKPPLTKVLEYQRFIFNDGRKEKLNEVLERFFIEASCPRLPELFKEIKGRRLQHILESKKNDFLNALFGFITKPELKPGQRWDISYEDFCNKIASLTETYRKGTKIFPSVTIPELDNQNLQEHNKHLFVKKIYDIRYQEVVPEAVRDYLAALKIVRDEFKNYSVSEQRTHRYTCSIVRRFQTQFRKHSRNCSNVIKDSKNFYDCIMLDIAPDFEGFESIPSEFRNGLLHSELDDETKNLKWRLEPDE